MAHVEATRARELAERIKRVARHPDLLDLCEFVLSGPAVVERPIEVSCLECARRRKMKALAQKRWRDGRRERSAG